MYSIEYLYTSPCEMELPDKLYIVDQQVLKYNTHRHFLLIVSFVG